MAFISPLVIDRLIGMLPDDKIELIDGGRAILVNGTVFHSDWAGEELEKFGILGAGLQDAILADFLRDMAPLLKGDAPEPEAVEPKVEETPKPAKTPKAKAPAVEEPKAPEAPVDQTPVEGSIDEATSDGDEPGADA